MTSRQYYYNNNIGAHQQQEDTKKNKTPINCGPCVCLFITLVTLAVIAIGILAAVALGSSYAHYRTLVYTKSGNLQSSPLGQSLHGNGGILSMTLPGTSDFYDRTFTITDLSGAAHTLALPAGVTFDGGFSLATFDGTIGSTLVYRRVSLTRVHVVSKYGVILS